jgi:hypothetical protein
LCVSVCVLLFVLVCLQCQEQCAQGKDEKDGEDFAGEGEKVHCVTTPSLSMVPIR